MKPNKGKLGLELAQLLRRIGREESDLRDEVKERRGRIAKLRKRGEELVDVIEGRAGVQLSVPGTEEGAKPRDSDRPKFTKRWHPKWDAEGVPVHAPALDGKCPETGKPWLDCATCVAAASGERRP